MAVVDIVPAKNEGEHQIEQQIKVSSSWCGPGPAAYDFRSDTITTPTLSMLQQIAQSTLMDDVYQEDTTTTEFEKFMAKLTGKEDSLLVMSGTMGNQIALRSLRHMRSSAMSRHTYSTPKPAAAHLFLRRTCNHVPQPTGNTLPLKMSSVRQ